jgi:thiamine biosynthesis protein ThiI
MKLASLISSGIDSPVATFLLSKKTEEIILIHGDNRPFTDNQEIRNFIEIGKYLKNKSSTVRRAYIVPYGEVISNFKNNCDQHLTCVFCKRILLRMGERIANNVKADGIIMGDSLGQVASQTIQNIKVIDQAVKIPVIRPLIGFDKEEIVHIAEDIGTYNLSIAKSKNCNAVPDKPATRAKLDKILLEEQKINIQELTIKAVEKAELIQL